MAQNDAIERIRANQRRARTMVKMRRPGPNRKTFAEIGSAFGVSKQRAQVIVASALLEAIGKRGD